MSKTVKIGITGGLGSGKSVVAELLSLYGISVYIADDESKRLTNTSPQIKMALTNLIGNDIYQNGALNKKLLADIIFKDQAMMNKINGIIHPVVADDFKKWCSLQRSPFCAVESAILFESGFNRLTNISLMVYAPVDIRVERALKRDHSSKEAILNRINSQMSDEIKREWADYTIINDGKQALIPQTEKFLREIEKYIR